jgi:predicted HicB family RNase H-like nuclease
MSKTFTIRMSDELFDQAVGHAEQSKTTVADLCRAGLAEKINGVSMAAIDAKLDKIIGLVAE